MILLFSLFKAMDCEGQLKAFVFVHFVEYNLISVYLSHVSVITS